MNRITTISLRIETDLKDMLKKLSDKDQRTLSSFIRLKLLDLCPEFNKINNHSDEVIPWEAQVFKKEKFIK